jgi:thermostable 8-oxoguanine DNA glycosylase
MTQKLVAKLNGIVQTLILPEPEAEVCPGVSWGQYDVLFTPAFWKALSWLEQEHGHDKSYRLGRNLTEEISACLLGGYGIPAEVGLVAFYRVRDCGLLSSTPSENDIYEVLSQPLQVGEKRIRYRFARQKSRYLSSALEHLAKSTPPEDAIRFRSWLLELDGIGYKTASWITRNWLDSDQVAIIDIHIHRAGLLMSLYHPKHSPAKDYIEMEDKFLDFANRIEVRASQLDGLIWNEMKTAGRMPLEFIYQKSLN